MFIDEIHKYPNWSRELKQIYDTYPDVQIRFTGSSILDIYKGTADLSRRAPIYDMQGLSFREYLNMFHHMNIPVYTIDEILEHKVEIPQITHPLPLFIEYLQQGYYPFGKDKTFEIELDQVINLTQNYPDIPLQKYDSYATAKSAMENGGVAWANDNTEVIAFASQNPGYTVGIPSLGSQDTIAPAVSKGNETLLNAINDEIKALGKENFFHADYEATLVDTYGTDYEDSLVVEGGETSAQ